MHERVERFRRRVEQHFGGRPGRGARYPEVLRAEAVAITDWAVTRGTRLSSVAKRLGVGQATLGRWLESPPEELPELRPVDLIESDEATTEALRSGGSLALVTAGGHRVEGLHLDEVALLLEALG
jgi:hypothetical protein